MRIHNIIPDFLKRFDSKETLTMMDLEDYFQKHSNEFGVYFPDHCPKTELRLQAALSKYMEKVAEIRIISETLPSLIEQEEKKFNRLFQLNLDLKYTLMVGTFGSNAFVTRGSEREIYFAVEKLSANPDHLKVIVAHESGHVVHFSLANQKEMDWEKIDWLHGFTTLYLEGVATYLSKKAVSVLEESIYYTYDDEGIPWLSFYQSNQNEIKQRFLADASSEWTMEKEREWFRLSGGKYFGFNRLGYAIGTEYIEHLVKEIGVEAACTFWVDQDVHTDIMEWLSRSIEAM